MRYILAALLTLVLSFEANAEYFVDSVRTRVIDATARIVYGYTADVRAIGESEGQRAAVGQQINSRCLALEGVCWAFGQAIEVYPNPAGNAFSPLIASEAAVVSVNPNNFSPKVGINLVLKNRKDGADEAAPGDDLFNYNSWAVFITSQPSADGESMGWTKGIHFGANSLGENKYGVTPVAIDMSRVKSDASVLTVRDRATGVINECYVENSEFVCRPQ